MTMRLSHVLLPCSTAAFVRLRCVRRSLTQCRSSRSPWSPFRTSTKPRRALHSTRHQSDKLKSTDIAGVVYTGSTLFATALVLLYMYQDKLLYFPTNPGASKLTKDNPTGYRDPSEYGIDHEDLMIRAKDGVHLHAWFMRQPDSCSRPTLIFFHGNAGNIGYRLPNAVELYRKVQCNVLLVDYRGFGHSEGEPTEEGLRQDAEAVLDAMLQREDIDKTKLVIFGRSLGGAVALHLAHKAGDKIAGVILENTFLSVSSMVDVLMPLLSYVKPLVLRINWDSETLIQSVNQPILLIAGEQDELVPTAHMRRLHELAAQSSHRAVWHSVPNGTHNDTWLRAGDTYYQVLRQFLESLGVESPRNSYSEAPEVNETGVAL